MNSPQDNILDQKREAADLEPLGISVKKTAQLIDHGESTVWLMLKDGRLEGVSVGRRKLVLYRSIKRLLGLAEAA
jgi:hypothetical protein